MNELLSELLTQKDYKSLSEFNLLLSKGSSDGFEAYVLNLLNDLFDFNHSVFLEYSNEGCIRTIVTHNITNGPMENYIEQFQKKDIVNKFIYSQRFKNSTEQVIILSDLIEKNKLTNQSDLFSKTDLYYDMYLVFNDLGDGIRILRHKSRGRFTPNDLAVAHYLCEVLASRYKSIQESKKFKEDLQLFNKNLENMNFGFMMFSKEFELINYNKLALSYSYDITGTYDISDFKAILYQEFNDNLKESYNNSFFKSINSFIVEVISTIVINSDNRIDKYYMVNIYNKIWFNRMLNKINYTKEKYNLTNREKEIVSLVSKGLSNKEIAENLYISVYTVKEHMKNISKKMNVSSRTGIISKLAM